MNSNMRTLLEKLSLDYSEVSPQPKSKQLMTILEAGIVSQRNAFLLVRLMSETTEEHHFQDLTDKECSINHFHVQDYLPSGIDLRRCLTEAIAFVKALEESLTSQYSSVFRIILACDNDEPSNCVIRFHKLRDDEPPWLLIDKLEDYAEEAILVIDTDGSFPADEDKTRRSIQ